MTLSNNVRRTVGIVVGALIGLWINFTFFPPCIGNIVGIAIGALIGRVAQWKDGAIYGAIISSILTLVVVLIRIPVDVSGDSITGSIYLDYLLLSVIGLVFGAIIGLLIGAIVGRILQAQAEGINLSVFVFIPVESNYFMLFPGCALQ